MINPRELEIFLMRVYSNDDESRFKFIPIRRSTRNGR